MLITNFTGHFLMDILDLCGGVGVCVCVGGVSIRGVNLVSLRTFSNTKYRKSKERRRKRKGNLKTMAEKNENRKEEKTEEEMDTGQKEESPLVINGSNDNNWLHILGRGFTSTKSFIPFLGTILYPSVHQFYLNWLLFKAVSQKYTKFMKIGHSHLVIKTHPTLYLDC